jgi:hypothetical protein
MKTFSNLWLPSWILLRMRNVSNNSCRENQNKHFMFSNVFPENHTVYDTVEKFGGARGAINDVAIWRKRVAWWISMATRTDRYCHAHVLRHTHGRVLTHTNKYITHCFSTVTMICERASILLYTYVILFIFHACVACYKQFNIFTSLQILMPLIAQFSQF